MKKSVTVHLGKKLFNIEEDAFDKLNEYLGSLHEFFTDYEDHEEIVTDIEARLAELFTERLKVNDPVITIKEVEMVIEKVGTVSDFEEVDRGKSKQRGRGKDTRIKSEKGESSKSETSRKRLMRDPNDMVIAGVCSGLATYYDFDVTFVRFTFAGLAILGLLTGGILTTLLVLTYFGLWYLMPEANSIGDRIKMQGQQVNLDQIKSLIDEKMKELPEKDVIEEKARSFSYRFGQSLRETMPSVFKGGETFMKFCVRITGLILYLSAFLSVIALITLYIALLVNLESDYVGVALYEITQIDYVMVLVALSLLIVATPLLLLMMLGSSMYKLKNRFKPFITSALIVIWIISVTVGTSLSIRVAPEVNSYVEDNKGEFFAVAHNESVGNFDKIVLLVEDQEPSYQNSLSIEVVEDSSSTINIFATDENAEEFSYEVEEGILLITYKPDDNNLPICFICEDDFVSLKISTPNLSAVEMKGDFHNYLSINGFNEVNFAMSERVMTDFSGRYGGNSTITFNINDNSTLTLDQESVYNSVINLNDNSHLYISSPFYGYGGIEKLELGGLEINTYDASRAELYLMRDAQLNAYEDSNIFYIREIGSVEVEAIESGNGKITERVVGEY